MKRKDIMIFVSIAVIATIFSYILAGVLFDSEGQRKEKVPAVEPISSEFPAVKSDSQYQAVFNSNALDPTQLIKIGTSRNQAPFNND